MIWSRCRSKVNASHFVYPCHPWSSAFLNHGLSALAPSYSASVREQAARQAQI